VRQTERERERRINEEKNGKYLRALSRRLDKMTGELLTKSFLRVADEASAN